MSLFKKIRRKAINEFIDIVEWTEETATTLIWRFPFYQAIIKNGAILTVRESQVAVLVNEGQLADVYKPGYYKLTTNNMPILSGLKGWKYAFDAPFKVDIYFVNTQEFLNINWATKNPIIMQDPEFGPIRLRAFGSYDLAENLNEFSSELLIALKDDFSNYGIELTKITLEKITLPEVMEASIDKRTCMGVMGSMNTYTQMRFPESLKNINKDPKSSDN